MKNFTVGVLVASLSLLGMQAVAQQSPAPREVAPSAGPGSAIESEKLIGARIKTPANKDMILAPPSREVRERAAKSQTGF